MFPLSNEDNARLKAFSKDLATIFALKKLFMNCFVKGKAASLDIELLSKAFQELDYIKDEEPKQDVKPGYL